jgi:hypothetical protein
MLLGELVTRFSDDAIAAEAVLGCGGIALFNAVREEAAAQGMTVGDFARAALSRYAAWADDAEWITLLGALARAPDPGAECLRRALDLALQQRVSGGAAGASATVRR